MGNWRRVHISGTCEAAEVEALRTALDPGEDYANFNALSSGSGLCGLNDWAAERMEVVGNLAERDYSPDDVATHLDELLQVVPSLDVKIHCGNDWEAADCIATVIVVDGAAFVTDPEVRTIPELDKAKLQGNLMAALMRPPGG